MSPGVSGPGCPCRTVIGPAPAPIAAPRTSASAAEKASRWYRSRPPGVHPGEFSPWMRRVGITVEQLFA
jgi:hypothetical protein